MEQPIRCYRQKLVQSGELIEIYNYAKPISLGKKRKPRIKKEMAMPTLPVPYKPNDDYSPREEFELSKYNVDLNPKLTIDVQKHFSLRRARGRIMRLVNSNPDLKSFLTLTFDSQKFNRAFVDLKECNLIFSNFIKRLKRRFPDLKYLAIPEFQSDYYHRTQIKKEHGGNIHYHLLCNLPFIDNAKLAQIWGHGFININNIRHVSRVGSYVAKYIGKALYDRRFFRSKRLFYSRKLNRPITILTSPKVKEYLKTKTGLNLLLTKNYRSDYQGMVDYSLYQEKK